MLCLGERCNCGTWVTPAFHIDMKKVDKSLPLKIATSSSVGWSTTKVPNGISLFNVEPIHRILDLFSWTTVIFSFLANLEGWLVFWCSLLYCCKSGQSFYTIFFLFAKYRGINRCKLTVCFELGVQFVWSSADFFNRIYGHVSFW